MLIKDWNTKYNLGKWPLIILIFLTFLLIFLLTFPELRPLPFSGLIRIISFLDKHESILTILGWGAVAFFGIRAAKIQLRNSAKLEIYKQLYNSKTKLDEKSMSLGLAMSLHSLPFLEMSWAQEGKNYLEPDKNPGTIWLDYIKKTQEKKFEFSDAYLEFMSLVNMWRAELRPLSKATDILFNELSILSEDIYAHISYLSDLLITTHDWTKWNQEDIKRRADEMQTKFDEVAVAYVSDFIDEIHGVLMQPIFNNRRVPREDFNYLNEVISRTLTRDGIKEIKHPPTRVALLRKSMKDRKTIK